MKKQTIDTFCMYRKVIGLLLLLVAFSLKAQLYDAENLITVRTGSYLHISDSTNQKKQTLYIAENTSVYGLNRINAEPAKTFKSKQAIKKRTTYFSNTVKKEIEKRKYKIKLRPNNFSVSSFPDSRFHKIQETVSQMAVISNIYQVQKSFIKEPIIIFSGELPFFNVKKGRFGSFNKGIQKGILTYCRSRPPPYLV